MPPDVTVSERYKVDLLSEEPTQERSAFSFAVDRLAVSEARRVPSLNDRTQMFRASLCWQSSLVGIERRCIYGCKRLYSDRDGGKMLESHGRWWVSAETGKGLLERTSSDYKADYEDCCGITWIEYWHHAFHLSIASAASRGHRMYVRHH